MTPFHVRALPDASAFLAGRGPVLPGFGVETERIQIYLRRGDDDGGDERPHAHSRCDEFFVVLAGSLVVEVEGRERVVGPREWCHFPPGQMHRIVRTVEPLEALVIRAPGVEDKLLG